MSAATSRDWNSGSANTHTALSERIFCRSSVSRLALGCTSGLTVMEPTASRSKRSSKYW